MTSRNSRTVNSHLYMAADFFEQGPKLHHLGVFWDFGWGWNVGDIRIVFPASRGTVTSRCVGRLMYYREGMRTHICI